MEELEVIRKIYECNNGSVMNLNNVRRTIDSEFKPSVKKIIEWFQIALSSSEIRCSNNRKFIINVREKIEKGNIY